MDDEFIIENFYGSYELLDEHNSEEYDYSFANHYTQDLSIDEDCIYSTTPTNNDTLKQALDSFCAYRFYESSYEMMSNMFAVSLSRNVGLNSLFRRYNKHINKANDELHNNKCFSYMTSFFMYMNMIFDRLQTSFEEISKMSKCDVRDIIYQAIKKPGHFVPTYNPDSFVAEYKISETDSFRLNRVYDSEKDEYYYIVESYVYDISPYRVLSGQLIYYESEGDLERFIESILIKVEHYQQEKNDCYLRDLLVIDDEIISNPIGLEKRQSSVVLLEHGALNMLRIKTTMYYSYSRNVFYISSHQYSQMCNLGIPCCRIKQFNHEDIENVGKYKLETKQLLKDYGYSLPDILLSEEQRHRILSLLMVNDICKGEDLRVCLMGWVIDNMYNKEITDELNQVVKDIKFIEGYDDYDFWLDIDKKENIRFHDFRQDT